jgi:hypothetical protein
MVEECIVRHRVECAVLMSISIKGCFVLPIKAVALHANGRIEMAFLGRGA